MFLKRDLKKYCFDIVKLFRIPSRFLKHFFFKYSIIVENQMENNITIRVLSILHFLNYDEYILKCLVILKMIV